MQVMFSTLWYLYSSLSAEMECSNMESLGKTIQDVNCTSPINIGLWVEAWSGAGVENEKEAKSGGKTEFIFD